MIIPPGIDGPLMLLRQHALHRFDRRRRWSRTGLGVEAVRAAEFTIEQPILRRHVLIWAGHLHAGRAAKLGGLRGGRGMVGVWPFRLLDDIEIDLLDLGRRRIV